MPKHVDNVPKLEDFRPPWVNAQGEESEINKDTLKKFIHNLLTDKAKAQDSRDVALEKVTAAEAERDEFKAEIDSKADPDSAKAITKLERQLEDAKADLAKAELRADRVEIAAEKGLTPKQAKRLQGATREELETDADELLEDLGITPGSNDSDEDPDDEEAELTGRTRPRAKRLVNGGHRGSSGADTEVDYEKIAAELMPGSQF